jgi:hypothetical protein
MTHETNNHPHRRGPGDAAGAPPMPVEDPLGAVELIGELQDMHAHAVEMSDQFAELAFDDAELAEIERDINDLMACDLDDSSMQVETSKT